MTGRLSCGVGGGRCGIHCNIIFSVAQLTWLSNSYSRVHLTPYSLEGVTHNSSILAEFEALFQHVTYIRNSFIRSVDVRWRCYGNSGKVSMSIGQVRDDVSAKLGQDKQSVGHDSCAI